MTFQAVPDCALVRCELLTSDLRSSINLHFAKPGFGQADLAALVVDIQTDFGPTLMAELNDNYTMDRITAWDLTAPDGYKATTGVAIVGGQPAIETPVSPALALVVSFYAARRGKWNQGRVYVPGLSEDWVDQVDIQPAHSGPIAAAFTDLITDPPTGWMWVIVSRYENKIKRPTGVYAGVESVVVRSPKFGIQRRRAGRT